MEPWSTLTFLTQITGRITGQPEVGFPVKGGPQVLTAHEKPATSFIFPNRATGASSRSLYEPLGDCSSNSCRAFRIRC
jgi:hypothetical protein